MVAHELATLNDAREENIALKKTAEHLRERNEGLLKRNVTLSKKNAALTLANGQYKEASQALGRAVMEAFGMAGVRKVKERAAEILMMPAPESKLKQVARAFKFGSSDIPVKQ